MAAPCPQPGRGWGVAREGPPAGPLAHVGQLQLSPALRRPWSELDFKKARATQPSLFAQLPPLSRRWVSGAGLFIFGRQ